MMRVLYSSHPDQMVFGIHPEQPKSELVLEGGVVASKGEFVASPTEHWETTAIVALLEMQSALVANVAYGHVPGFMHIQIMTPSDRATEAGIPLLVANEKPLVELVWGGHDGLGSKVHIPSTPGYSDSALWWKNRFFNLQISTTLDAIERHAKIAELNAQAERERVNRLKQHWT